MATAAAPAPAPAPTPATPDPWASILDQPSAPVLDLVANRLRAGYTKAGRRDAASGSLIAILMAFLQQFLAGCTPASVKSAATKHPWLVRMLLVQAMQNHGGIADVQQAADAALAALDASSTDDVDQFIKARAAVQAALSLVEFSTAV